MKALLYIALTACVALCIGSCTRTLYVPVESEHVTTDTVRSVQLRVDSVWLRDSIVTLQRGDTVWIERYRDRYRYLLTTDTLWQTHTDSVVKREPYPVEVVKEVPRQLSWWQSIRLWIGNVSLGVILLVLGFGAWRFYRRLRR